jgi:hypothetical protein
MPGGSSRGGREGGRIMLGTAEKVAQDLAPLAGREANDGANARAPAAEAYPDGRQPRHSRCLNAVAVSWPLQLRDCWTMPNNAELLPPIIEPWRVLTLILIVVAGMTFAHAIDPSHAKDIQPHPVLSSAP